MGFIGLFCWVFFPLNPKGFLGSPYRVAEQSPFSIMVMVLKQHWVRRGDISV